MLGHLVTGLALMAVVGCASTTAPATNPVSTPTLRPTPTDTAGLPTRTPTMMPTFLATSHSSDHQTFEPTAERTGEPTTTPTELPTVPPSATPEATAALGPNGFPLVVDGMPVVSVAEAKQLLDAGQLDGRVVAIGGFFSSTPLSCPSSAFIEGPLVSSPSCVAVGFADNVADAHVCHSIRNGMSCQSRPVMAPIGVPETTGTIPYHANPDDPFMPDQIVVLVHADDARKWQCSQAALAECHAALVADRFAWADGSTVTPDEPQLWDSGGYLQVPLRMSLADIQTAVGPGQILTAAPFQARDIWTVDPRWNLAGDEAVWLVRTFASEPESSDPTRTAEVSLIEDATGRVVDSHALAIDPGYAPGRVWLSSERRDLDALGNVPDELESFYRVTSSTGSVVNEQGPWRSLPVVLPGGDYSVETWLATYVEGVQGLPSRSCSTSIHLDPLGNFRLLAYYEPDKQCVWTTEA